MIVADANVVQAFVRRARDVIEFGRVAKVLREKGAKGTHRVRVSAEVRQVVVLQIRFIVDACAQQETRLLEERQSREIPVDHVV